MTGPTSTQVDHSPRAGTTTSKVTRPGATRSASAARISTPRATGAPAVGVGQRRRPVAVGRHRHVRPPPRWSRCRGGRRRPPAPPSRRTGRRSRRRPGRRPCRRWPRRRSCGATSSSRIPWPTWRWRNTMRVESARPGAGRFRDTNVAEKGSSLTAASGSARTPLTSTSKRDRIRVSRKKRPWAAPGAMSPAPPLMAKVDSSTRVTDAGARSELGDRAGVVPGVGHGGTVPAGPAARIIPQRAAGVEPGPAGLRDSPYRRRRNTSDGLQSWA